MKALSPNYFDDLIVKYMFTKVNYNGLGKTLGILSVMPTISVKDFFNKSGKSISFAPRKSFLPMKITFLITLLFALTLTKASAQERPPHEIHAAMVYNFIKYVQWPNENDPGDFVLGVIGDDKILGTLKQWYEGKSKGSKKFIVKKLDGASQAAECQAVYIGNSKNKNFDDVKSAIAGKSVLTITDGAGMAERGSCINFRMIEGKLKFELNQSAIGGSNLKVSGQLTSMAIVI